MATPTEHSETYRKHQIDVLATETFPGSGRWTWSYSIDGGPMIFSTGAARSSAELALQQGIAAAKARAESPS